MNTNKIPLVMKFYADWCSPCKTYAPIVNEVAKELNLEVQSLNVDDHPQLLKKFGIKSIPTIVVEYPDLSFDILAGSTKKEELKQWLQKNLTNF